ncbi:glycoside hydrolase family 3 C-terminal domain-containing protein [Telluria mixta]|uniref:Glycoside hydrolase family 3 C-terminal domain-containing protein n=1 Tax=Telluria mixta TaxID=34071 RepID=A0ABT2C5F0_9BURK|nr:glycoside hydrolase family 3 C-terminal domain-containing protein [Telluria mixta]MCS0632594.1 glycoside hydrolase family 3 C-terminal domain-containing protein [Telluria mixta]WEM99114.1 glycoside hydrolase family 3 C-terminal domain-containing protein [Telluria mixta]
MLAAAMPAAAQTTTTSPDARTDADARARNLVEKMTLDEKIDQLLNVAPALPRLGIPAYNWWTESLHGALGPLPTTNFPEPIGLAATFDAPLVHKVASAISTEVRALHTLGRQTGHLGRIGTGLDTWSPNINIFRDPRWGRGQETYGEDPYLTAQLGVAFIQGIQGPNPDLPDVVATPKHFAVHSGPESTRHVADVFVSRHDLEDTYLPAFRAAIVDAKAGSIMCAYNRINGQPACGSDLLLKEHLRGAWGFKGYVVSDCDAVTDIDEHHKYAPDPAAAAAVALKAGTDNECNTKTLGDAKGLGERYREAWKRGLISMGDIDTALVRLFSARYRNGDLAGLAQRKPNQTPVNAIDTPTHRDLALQAANKSLVLLKNDGTLPLKPGVKVAVIGPLADATRVLRGNYSSTQSAPPVSVVDGLRRVLPQARVTLVPAAASITDGDPVPTTALRTPDGKPGLRAEYINGTDTKPVLVRTEPGLESHALQFKDVADKHKVVWTGALVAPESGMYRLGVTGVKGELKVGGKPAVQASTYSQWGEPLKLTDVRLEKGQRYPLRFQAETGSTGVPGLFWKRISTAPEQDLKAGTADADVIVAVVGLTSDLEGEEMAIKVEGFAGGDKTSLDLPAEQRALLERAKALGKPLVVVVMNGSAIDLSWAKINAAAILEAWYPGQSGGAAIADVLTGRTDPGGRLPLTFYRSLADLPPFDDYSMQGRTYRYYTGTPVYPFGAGLSYTTFSYAPLRIEPVGGSPENGIVVTTEVANTGKRDGDEVAQLYLTPPAFEGAPRLALRGFQRVPLKAGERKQVSFTLSPRDLSFVTRDGVRQLTPGQYKLTVGSGQPGTGVAQQDSTVTLKQTVVLAQ